MKRVCGKLSVVTSKAGIPYSRCQVSVFGQESLEYIRGKAHTWKITEAQACSRIFNELLDAELNRI